MENIYVTETIYSKKQAINRKMNAIQPQLFGKKLIVYEVTLYVVKN